MRRPSVQSFLLCILFASLTAHVHALQPNQVPNNLPGATGTSAGAPKVKILKFPDDLRDFRSHALAADGYFTPDIAFSICSCPNCKNSYVFGVFPRLTRAPYDSLAAVHRSIEESLHRPTPHTMYSEREHKMVARACPYCGQAEHDAHPNKVYFCHQLVDTGDELHIEYTVQNEKLTGRIFWKLPKESPAEKVVMPDESEGTFMKAFGCHFSLRAVWNEIFATHWDDDKVLYEKAAPGVWLIFRPAKVNNEAFLTFEKTQLAPDKEKGLFSRVESVLKIDDKVASDSTYVQWAPDFAEKISKSTAECFVAMSLAEMRNVAAAAVASRKATLNLTPSRPTMAGSGFIQRGPLRVPITLAPLVKLAATGGLSLNQAGSFYLGDGCYALDNSEYLAKKIQAVLPECNFDFEDGKIMVATDKAKEERRIDLFPLATKLDPDDLVLFQLYRDRILRFDEKKKLFGNPPLSREISPIGLPALIERRIRPPEHLVKHKALSALFEPFFDTDGKRCDLCYTCECTSTVVYVDPTKPQFADIKDVNDARRIYYADEGLTTPLCGCAGCLAFSRIIARNGRMHGADSLRVGRLIAGRECRACFGARRFHPASGRNQAHPFLCASNKLCRALATQVDR